MLEERGGGRGASVAGAARRVNISVLANDLLGVLREQRETPETLAVLATGLGQRLGERVAVAEETGTVLTEGNHARAGQRRDVDDVGRLVLVLHEGERVGKAQAAFGIGVADL